MKLPVLDAREMDAREMDAPAIEPAGICCQQAGYP
jgi:hypothetical protein